MIVNGIYSAPSFIMNLVLFPDIYILEHVQMI